MSDKLKRLYKWALLHVAVWCANQGGYSIHQSKSTPRDVYIRVQGTLCKVPGVK